MINMGVMKDKYKELTVQEEVDYESGFDALWDEIDTRMNKPEVIKAGKFLIPVGLVEDYIPYKFLERALDELKGTFWELGFTTTYAENDNFVYRSLWISGWTS